MESKTKPALFPPDLRDCPERAGFAELFSFFGERLGRVHRRLCCPFNTFLDLPPNISATDLLKALQSQQQNVYRHK